MRDGAEVRIGTDEVASGDIVVVKTGETVPVDGVILEGTALLNESALTGESLPVTRGPGEAVTGATLLAAGAFRMRATRVGDDTVLRASSGSLRRRRPRRLPWRGLPTR